MIILPPAGDIIDDYAKALAASAVRSQHHMAPLDAVQLVPQQQTLILPRLVHSLRGMP